MNDEIEGAELEALQRMASEGLEAFASLGEITKVEEALSARIDEQIVDRRSWLKWILIAAAVICLGLIYVFTRSKEPVPAIDYRMAFYEAPPFVLSGTSRGAAEDVLDLGAIRDAYKSKQFDRVLQLSMGIEEAVPGIALYQGVALLEINQIPASIAALEKVGDSELEDMRHWYLAQALLRDREKDDAAQVLLKKIASSSEHYKRDQAREILSGLSSMD